LDFPRVFVEVGDVLLQLPPPFVPVFVLELLRLVEQFFDRDGVTLRQLPVRVIDLDVVRLGHGLHQLYVDVVVVVVLPDFLQPFLVLVLLAEVAHDLVRLGQLVLGVLQHFLQLHAFVVNQVGHQYMELFDGVVDHFLDVLFELLGFQLEQARVLVFRD